VTTAGRFLLANPIILIATGIALAAVLIYKNWDKIGAFFTRLWQGVKTVFTRFWTSAKSLFLSYTPYGLVIKHWSKIVPMFGAVWNNVKKVFTATWQWISGLGKLFFDAGKNIVTSIWNGIKALAHKPVEAIKNMVGKIRKFLPFSPAKEGPLKDIHKIRLVETIAQSINARPLIDAWHNVTGKLFGEINRPQAIPAGVGSGSRSQINFSPTINLYGGATQADAKMIDEHLRIQFKKLMADYERSNSRRSF